MNVSAFPLMRAVADTGVLVQFGQEINDIVHQRVLSFDANIQSASINGLTECIPSYTSVLVGYDPLQTTYDKVAEQLEPLLSGGSINPVEPHHWQIPTCYASRLAHDLEDAAKQLDFSPKEIIHQHCSGHYKVYMYGFAPGYAYMGGVPQSIQLARKPAPVMNVPPQTVMIAGSQCLITTLPMPTGWWRIGMTNFKPLDMQSNKPFVFNIGDTIQFVAVSENDYIKHNAAE